MDEQIREWMKEEIHVQLDRYCSFVNDLLNSLIEKNRCMGV